MKIKAETYFCIQAWMVTELKLRTVERDVYAIIYGYSQDGDSNFHGSIAYLSELTGYSKNSVCDALKSLTNKGFILKEEYEVNNVKMCRYKASALDTIQAACIPTIQAAGIPIQAACINNNIDNNQTNKNVLLSKDNNTRFEFGKRSTKKATLWDKCVNMIDAFTGNSDIRKGLIECLKLFIQNSKEADRPFYSNNFKGKLNNLAKLSYNPEEQLKIIRQTLDRGYNDFYEVTEGKSTKRNAITDIEHLDSSKMSHATDKEKQELKEAIRNGTAEKF